MAKKYIVDLNKDEKTELVTLTQKGRPGARKIKRANILLLADTGKPDFEIAELLHTSWLNMAEVEISVITEQCFDRRLGSQVIVASEVGAWESERNAARATIDWRFTVPNARDKLMKLYPVREE
jgi:hypothetical protein